MASFAEIAKVTMRGGDIPEPGSRDEQVILAAWKMYRCVSAKAMQTGREMVRLDVEGHTWVGDMSEIGHLLWPAGQVAVTGTDWLDSFQTVRNWLLATQNIAVTDRGRPETRTRNEGVIGSRPAHWWVRDQFTGAPEGMRLPDLDADGKPVPVITLPSEPLPAASPPAATASVAEPRDWWCPFEVTGNCPGQGPYTKQELRMHIIDRPHRIKPGGFLYDQTMRDANDLHEDRLGTQPPPPPPAVGPPARSLIDMADASPLAIPVPAAPPPPPPAPVRAPVQAPATAAVPAAARAGSIAAQARVFSGMVADLEVEVTRLQRENRLLRERAERAEAGLSQADIDRIARRTVSLLQSRDGN